MTLRALLAQRAALLKRARHFFDERGVLEVVTPALLPSTVTDPYLRSFCCDWLEPGATSSQSHLYLQTSPEYAMKRLLVAGSGAIYQLSQSFRNEEYGRYHFPAFMMLEWYQLGFDLNALMNEVDAFMQTLVGTAPAQRMTYQAAFEQICGFDPHRISMSDLKQALEQRNIVLSPMCDPNDRDLYLQLFMTEVVEKALQTFQDPIFIYDYPATQAALARVHTVGEGSIVSVAARFELYWKGIELANGYHELSNAAEQRRRFQEDLAVRSVIGAPAVPVDELLLSALEDPGLPDCAGVALGFDRICLLAQGLNSLSDLYGVPYYE